MAQAIVIRKTGGPEVLKLETGEVGCPAPGEIRTRQTVIGVNFDDVYVRSGLYQTLGLPGIPGIDALGVAYDAVGEDTFLGSPDCLALRGHLVNFGQASGPVEPLAVSRLSAKSNTLSRPMIFHYVSKRAGLRACRGLAHDFLGREWNAWLDPAGPRAVQRHLDAHLALHHAALSPKSGHITRCRAWHRRRNSHCPSGRL